MPVRISSYAFGQIMIDGREFASDVIIYPDHVDDKWWRAQGHHCCLADLAAALVPGLKTLIIGTGEPGLMAVEDDLREYCRDHGIELAVLPTAQSVDAYNGCPDKTSVIAAFHLTC